MKEVYVPLQNNTQGGVDRMVKAGLECVYPCPGRSFYTSELESDAEEGYDGEAI